MKGIRISNEFNIAVNEACSIGDNYLTIGFSKNSLLVAVQSIRGYISVIPTQETFHKTFMIRINREILKEAINGGYIEVNRVDEVSTCITTYRDEACELLVSKLVFASSYSDTLGSFMGVIDTEKMRRLTIQNNLLSTEVYDLLLTTEDNLNHSNTDYYSTGNGVSFYVESKPECDKLTLDTNSIRLIQKNIKGAPEIYFNEEFKTYICKRGHSYFTWRSEYNRETDLSRVRSIEPIARLRLGIPKEMPMTSNRKFTKAKEVKYTQINIRERSYSVKSTLFQLNGSFDVEQEEGLKIEEIRVNSMYVKYLVSDNTIEIEVFKKFIRVHRDFILMDIACDVILQ